MSLFLYKQFNFKDGILHPLFVDREQEVPVGVWLTAQVARRNAMGKVLSKLGPLAFRPGWHLCEVPYAPHIGIKEDGKIKYMHDNTVWCLVEVYDEVDYTIDAHARGVRNGKFIARDACLDTLPVNGYYWYNTNPTAFGNWAIAHRIRVIRILDDDEVEDICWKQFGIHSQPHRPGHKFTLQKGA